jgi:hypothetical protein
MIWHKDKGVPCVRKGIKKHLAQRIMEWRVLYRMLFVYFVSVGGDQKRLYDFI